MPPFVSIIVPCYNEEKTIHHLLDAVLAQTYPREQMELIIADAMSVDGTQAVIREFQSAHGDLHLNLLQNSIRTIPSGLNQAIRAARGELIVRLDAHSVPIAEYVERCVRAHDAGKGLNIGGVWEIRAGAQTWIAESIATAAAHPLGAGDAMYRLNAKEGAVDTVPFGSFRRATIESLGMFDESLLTNEDYEFNVRVRKSGGTVWLDPSIRSTYFSRSTLVELARQYFRYGYWKWRMLRRDPGTLRWRQALPPVFVLGLVLLTVLSLWVVPARFMLAALLAVYFVILALAAFLAAVERRKLVLLMGLPLAIATMHFAWGCGFLWSALRGLFLRHD